MRLRSLASWWLAVGSLAACSANGGGGVYIVPDADTEDRPPAADDTRATGCALPQQMCGGACVDVTVSPVNCGSCGNRCAAGQTCTSGSCVTSSTCAAPRAMCGASCTDTSTDVNHCGACGTRCNSGQSCAGGVCTGGGSCAPPRTMCDTCTDIQTDSANCGLCGFRCPTGQSCAAGACRTGSTGCASPRTMCGAVCTDTSSDTANCGACGLRCATGQTCAGARCTTVMGSTSRAGAPCVSDTDCGTGALQCQAVGARGFCTAACDDGTATSERAQCDGNGSTCLTQGDGATANSFCTTACVPGGGSCRAGTVCTGWWYTHTAGGDDPGCFPFCGANSDCASPTPVCNTRTGSCGATGVDSSRLPDGAACNPMMTVTVPGEMTPRNVQCRGICFGISSTNRTQGLCGSFLNLANSTSCVDSPMVVQPRAPAGEDDLGICIFRSCARNSECGAGLVCIYPETMGAPVTTADRLCQYATAAQPTGAP